MLRAVPATIARESAGHAAGRSASPAASTTQADQIAGQVVVLVLAQMKPGSRAWGWWRIVRGPGALRGEPGLRFAKVLGSGHEGGFGLRPSGSRLGLFLLSPLGGELIDGVHFADGSSMTPAAYGSRAFVMTNGGALLGLHVIPPT